MALTLRLAVRADAPDIIRMREEVGWDAERVYDWFDICSYQCGSPECPTSFDYVSYTDDAITIDLSRLKHPPDGRIFRLWVAETEKEVDGHAGPERTKVIVAAIGLSHLDLDEMDADLACWERRRGLVRSLAVFNAFKGQGIGTWMMRRIEDEARHLGLKVITSLVPLDNAPSLALHEKFGYRVFKRAPRNWAEDVLHYEKVL
ncbi:hypothetical protein SpCBS45565_g04265 [Spizellomyces sp. 'palustris']|nr:hypothetical protein SpCBS45565_g04265 [Spizellomyces sp. 'palustris']